MGVNKLERIRSVLCDSQFYFSKPDELDDPFEFKPRNMILKKFKRVIPLNPEWQEAIEAGVLKGIDAVTANRSESLNGLGVCCFSEAIDETLMWSHYAEGHRGIAIEFDAAHPYFSRLLHVDYQDQRKDVGLRWQIPEIIQKVILVKSTNWQYQREWRLLNGNGGALSRFPIDVVTGVILGAKCSDEHVSAVLEMVKSLNIKCFRADLSKHNYGIHFADLNATNA
jgi:hypothetical protein